MKRSLVPWCFLLALLLARQGWGGESITLRLRADGETECRLLSSSGRTTIVVTGGVVEGLLSARVGAAVNRTALLGRYASIHPGREPAFVACGPVNLAGAYAMLANPVSASVEADRHLAATALRLDTGLNPTSRTGAEVGSPVVRLARWTTGERATGVLTLSPSALFAADRYLLETLVGLSRGGVAADPLLSSWFSSPPVPQQTLHLALRGAAASGRTNWFSFAGAASFAEFELPGLMAETSVSARFPAAQARGTIAATAALASPTYLRIDGRRPTNAAVARLRVVLERSDASASLDGRVVAGWPDLPEGTGLWSPLWLLVERWEWTALLSAGSSPACDMRVALRGDEGGPSPTAAGLTLRIVPGSGAEALGLEFGLDLATQAGALALDGLWAALPYSLSLADGGKLTLRPRFTAVVVGGPQESAVESGLLELSANLAVPMVVGPATLRLEADLKTADRFIRSPPAHDRSSSLTLTMRLQRP